MYIGIATRQCVCGEWQSELLTESLSTSTVQAVYSIPFSTPSCFRFCSWHSHVWEPRAWKRKRWVGTGFLRFLQLASVCSSSTGGYYCCLYLIWAMPRCTSLQWQRVISACWWADSGWADSWNTTSWRMSSIMRTRVSCRRPNSWRTSIPSICQHDSITRRNGREDGSTWSIRSERPSC